MKNYALKGLATLVLSIFIFAFANAQDAKDTGSKTYSNLKIQTNVWNWMNKSQIEDGLIKEAGIAEVKVDMDEKITLVKYEPSKITSKKILDLMDDMGFDVAVVEEKIQDNKASTESKPVKNN